MQIVKTFGQSLYEPKFGTRKAVNKTVVIGNYPTLTIDQLEALVKEYEKNPEPNCYYYVQNSIRILNPLCVNKTYPDYWKDFKKLTGASFEIPKAK